MKHWVLNRYGSRRGFILTHWHRMLYMLGKYKAYQQIDWDSVVRLVFVCKGNICRSAFAEAIARTSGVKSISCGIETVSGASANQAAIDTANKRNIDLSEHKTTPIQSVSFKKGDLLVAMEPLQLKKLQHGPAKEYVSTLLGLWGRPPSPYIEDPYDASSVYFNHCFNTIEKSVHEITKKINK